MSTPLMFVTAHLLEESTALYLFPHIINFCPETKRWKAKPWNSWKLIPFYFTNIVLIFGLGFNSCLLQILKYMLNLETRVSGKMVMMQIFIMTGSVMGWALNFPAFGNATRMVEYMNAVIEFEEDHTQNLNFINAGVGFKNLLKCICCMLQKESQNFIRGKQTDYMGILHLGLVAHFSLITFIAPPAAVFYKLDPFYFLFQDLGIISGSNQSVITVIVRLIFAWICVAETFRTGCLIVNPLLMEHCIYNKVVKILRKRKTSPYVVHIYTQLCIVQSAGDEMIAYAISLLLGGAFFLSVIVTCFIFVGWKFFPLSLYLCGIPFSFVIHLVTHIVFPLMVDSHDESRILIRNDWPVRFLENKLNLRIRKNIRKCLLALRPIAFKSKLLHQEINIDTRRRFTANIIFRTMDLLLLSDISI